MIRRAIAAAVVTFLALSAAGCSQSKGGVCQVNADCDDGLTCNAGTERCQARGAVTVDAGSPDAHPPDARPE
jgi:hypothetical protein